MSQLERAKDAAINAVDKMSGADASLGDYISALEDVIDHAKTLADAARDDLRTQQRREDSGTED